MVISAKINTKQFEKVVGAALARGSKAGLLRAGLRVEKESRNRAPVDTGSLKSSITSQWISDRRFLADGFVTIGPNVKSEEGAPYDVYQEFGTGIHGPRKKRIRPRTKKFLAWVPRAGGGFEINFAKSVSGVKPVEYMQKGFEATPVDTEFAKGFNSVRR